MPSPGDGPMQPEEVGDFDIETIIQHLRESDMGMHQLDGRDIILLLGGTRVGKTVCAHVLCQRAMLVKKIDVVTDATLDFVMVADTNGVPRPPITFKESVIDTKEPLDGAKIGHSNDAETFVAAGFPIPGTEHYVCDPPGTGETRNKGGSLDAANAIVLHNIATKASKLRPVLLLGAQSLQQPGYIKEQMGIFSRFFSPVKDFLPSLTILLSKPGDDQKLSRVVTTLAKLLSAEHVREDPDMFAFVRYALETSQRLGDAFIVSPTRPDAPSVYLKAILDRPSIDSQAKLGFPFTSEVRHCLEIAVEKRSKMLASQLAHRQHAEAMKTLDDLHCFYSHIKLPVVARSYSDATIASEKHVDLLCKGIFLAMEENRWADVADDIAVLESMIPSAAYVKNVSQAHRDVRSKMSDTLSAASNQLATVATGTVTHSHASALLVAKLMAAHVDSYVSQKASGLFREYSQKIQEAAAKKKADAEELLSALEDAVSACRSAPSPNLAESGLSKSAKKKKRQKDNKKMAEALTDSAFWCANIQSDFLALDESQIQACLDLLSDFLALESFSETLDESIVGAYGTFSRRFADALAAFVDAADATFDKLEASTSTPTGQYNGSIACILQCYRAIDDVDVALIQQHASVAAKRPSFESVSTRLRHWATTRLKPVYESKRSALSSTAPLLGSVLALCTGQDITNQVVSETLNNALAHIRRDLDLLLKELSELVVRLKDHDSPDSHEYDCVIDLLNQWEALGQVRDMLSATSKEPTAFEKVFSMVCDEIQIEFDRRFSRAVQLLAPGKYGDANCDVALLKLDATTAIHQRLRQPVNKNAILDSVQQVVDRLQSAVQPQSDADRKLVFGDVTMLFQLLQDSFECHRAVIPSFQRMKMLADDDSTEKVSRLARAVREHFAALQTECKSHLERQERNARAALGEYQAQALSAAMNFLLSWRVLDVYLENVPSQVYKQVQEHVSRTTYLLVEKCRRIVGSAGRKDPENAVNSISSFLNECQAQLPDHLPDLVMWCQLLEQDVETMSAGAHEGIIKALERKQFSKAARLLQTLVASENATRDQHLRFQRAVEVVEDALHEFETEFQEEFKALEEERDHADPTLATVTAARERLRAAKEIMGFTGLVDLELELLYCQVWASVVERATLVQQRVLHLIRQMKFPAASKLFSVSRGFAGLDKMKMDGTPEDALSVGEVAGGRDLATLFDDLLPTVENIPRQLNMSLQAALEAADADDVKIARIFNACCKAAAETLPMFPAKNLDLDFEDISANLKRQFRRFWEGVFREGAEHAIQGNLPEAERYLEQLKTLQAIASDISGLRSPDDAVKKLYDDIAVRRSDLTYRALSSSAPDDLPQCLAELISLPPKPFKDASKELLAGAELLLQSAEGANLFDHGFDFKRAWNSSVGVLHRFYNEARKCPGCTPDLHRLGEDVHKLQCRAEDKLRLAIDKATRQYLDMAQSHDNQGAFALCQHLAESVKDCVPEVRLPFLAEDLETLNVRLQKDEELRHRVRGYSITKPMDMEVLQKRLSQLRRGSTSPAKPRHGAAHKSLDAVEEVSAYEDALEALLEQVSASRNILKNLLLKDEVSTIGVVLKNVKGLMDQSMADHICVAQAASKTYPGLRADMLAFQQERLKEFATAVDESNFGLLNTAYERLRKYIPDVFDCKPKVLSAVTRKVDAIWNPIAKRLADSSGEFRPHRVAEALVQIEKCRSALKDGDLRELVKSALQSCIEEVNNGANDGGMMQLAQELADMKVKESESILGYAHQFSAIRAKRRIEATSHVTFGHAMKEMRECPGISQVKVKALYQQYTDAFQAKLDEHEYGWTRTKLEGDIAAVKRQIQSISTKSGRSSDSRLKLAAAVGQISFIWAAMQSIANKQSAISIRPHPVQVIAMFVLLGLADDQENVLDRLLRRTGFSRGPSIGSLPGSLVQLGTGEGKSIVLGLVGIVLALLGYDVDSVCYNETLSNRDRDSFREMFEAFGVDKDISYSTLAKLAEKTINKAGSVRDVAHSVFMGEVVPVGQASPSARPNVLLVDEVDVFFSEEFLGVTYNPLTRIKTKETVEMFKWMWNHRAERLCVSNVQARVEYTQLVDALGACTKPFIDKQLQRMLEDLYGLPFHSYKIAEKRIGYESHGTISTSTYIGYSTTFAYLQEVERGNIPAESAEEELSLFLNPGNFAYAEIPKGFSRIVGVSGTLSALTEKERELLRQEYNVNQFVPLPSIYGDSKLLFPSQSPQGIVCEPDVDRFHQKILQECKDERADRDRAVIVFFDTEEHLQQFRGSEYGQSLDLSKVQVLTEETEDLEFHIQRATSAGMVTLSTRTFGRGTDFQCHDPSVIQSGGVHVIQTFFSMEEAEEVQIKGRTARQRSAGSFQLILLRNSLADTVGISQADLDAATSANTLYAVLHAKRTSTQADRISRLSQGMKQSRACHEQSQAFIAAARGPSQRADAFPLLMELNGVPIGT